MLETGQPLHVYDYDRLLNQEIIVRKALNGEKMTNLKGQPMALNNEDIVISAGKEIISLVGIIGSQATAISSKTTNILIESSFFNPCFIKKTSQRLHFATRAGQHFSKKYNLPFGNYALTRIIKLIKEIYPNAVEKNMIS
jgi:phenylalanyl-tRNA synthetase beta chain